jgi:nucleoid-associated protein YgaU
MSQKTLFVTITMVAIAFCTSGCDCSQKLASAETQNKALTQRVAELENQLSKADVAATQRSQEPAAGSVYVVKFGDSLWSIAKNELGSGARYEDILAQNPGLTEELAVGSKLKLPAK